MAEEKKSVQKQSKKQEEPKKVAPAPDVKHAAKKAETKPLNKTNSSIELAENREVSGEGFSGTVVWISQASSLNAEDDVVCIRTQSGKKVRKTRKDIKTIK